jgi:hypothetical protein
VIVVDEDWVNQRAASGGSVISAPSPKKAKAAPAPTSVKAPPAKKAKASAPVSSSSGPLSGLCFAITGQAQNLAIYDLILSSQGNYQCLEQNLRI